MAVAAPTAEKTMGMGVGYGGLMATIDQILEKKKPSVESGLKKGCYLPSDGPKVVRNTVTS